MIKKYHKARNTKVEGLSSGLLLDSLCFSFLHVLLFMLLALECLFPCVSSQMFLLQSAFGAYPSSNCSQTYQSYNKATVANTALSLISTFTASVEEKANEELQELMADQVNQVMKVQ